MFDLLAYNIIANILHDAPASVLLDKSTLDHRNHTYVKVHSAILALYDFPRK